MDPYIFSSRLVLMIVKNIGPSSLTAVPRRVLTHFGREIVETKLLALNVKWDSGRNLTMY